MLRRRFHSLLLFLFTPFLAQAAAVTPSISCPADLLGRGSPLLESLVADPDQARSILSPYIDQSVNPMEIALPLGKRELEKLLLEVTGLIETFPSNSTYRERLAVFRNQLIQDLQTKITLGHLIHYLDRFSQVVHALRESKEPKTLQEMEEAFGKKIGLNAETRFLNWRPDAIDSTAGSRFQITGTLVAHSKVIPFFQSSLEKRDSRNGSIQFRAVDFLRLASRGIYLAGAVNRHRDKELFPDGSRYPFLDHDAIHALMMQRVVHIADGWNKEPVRSTFPELSTWYGQQPKKSPEWLDRWAKSVDSIENPLMKDLAIRLTFELFHEKAVLMNPLDAVLLLMANQKKPLRLLDQNQIKPKSYPGLINLESVFAEDPSGLRQHRKAVGRKQLKKMFQMALDWSIEHWLSEFPSQEYFHQLVEAHRRYCKESQDEALSFLTFRLSRCAALSARTDI